MTAKVLGFGIAACLLLSTVLPVHAADGKAAAKADTVTWVHPVIPRFGGVHPRPDAAVQPDPDADYKVFVDVSSTETDPTKSMGALDRLARLVNLMGYAKVPPEHVHIVALLDEKAGMAALTDAAYAQMMFKFDPAHAKKGMKNPNLAVLHALKKAGVQLMVCSQALAGLGLPDSAIDPSVTVTLSGLTDPVVYGQRGYTFMQL